jgi:phage gp16-like protein
VKSVLIGNKEKAIIHIAKQQLQMTESEYRLALLKIGVTSSRELSFSQYEEFLQKLKAAGFVLASKQKRIYGRRPQATWDKEPLLKKIEALLAEMKLTWSYADGIARRMFKVDCVSWCAADRLHSIVAALEYKRRRTN